MTQNMMPINLFGISDITRFFKMVDSCDNAVFLSFNDTIYNLKENEELRRMMTAMSREGKLNAILSLSVNTKDIGKVVGYMQTQAA